MAALAVVAAALVFEPWKLVVDQRVEEAPHRGGRGPGRRAPADRAGRPRPRQLISHEHESSGSVVVCRASPTDPGCCASRTCGPATVRPLQVWLSDAPVIDGPRGLDVFDDGRYVDLGELKGNIGSSNYPIPPDVDLAAPAEREHLVRAVPRLVRRGAAEPHGLTDQARPAPPAGSCRSPRRSGAARGEECGHGIGVGQLLRGPDGAERRVPELPLARRPRTDVGVRLGWPPSPGETP